MRKNIQVGVALGKPKKKYRILIRELKTNVTKKEAMTSFMIYDYSGRSTLKSVKEKLSKMM